MDAAGHLVGNWGKGILGREGDHGGESTVKLCPVAPAVVWRFWVDDAALGCEKSEKEED